MFKKAALLSIVLALFLGVNISNARANDVTEFLDDALNIHVDTTQQPTGEYDSELPQGGLIAPLEGSYDNSIESANVVDVILRVTNFFLWFVGLIAFLVLLYAGYLYLISLGAPETNTKAKQTIIGALAGILIIVLAYAIVNTVLVGVTTGEPPVSGTIAGGENSGALGTVTIDAVSSAYIDDQILLRAAHSGTATNYIWELDIHEDSNDDGITDNDHDIEGADKKTPTHTYTTTGTKEILLKVEGVNSSGQAISRTASKTINVSTPLLRISSDTSVIRSASAQTGSSRVNFEVNPDVLPADWEESGLELEWNFGSGAQVISDDGVTAEVQYSTPGTKEVTLLANGVVVENYTVTVTEVAGVDLSADQSVIRAGEQVTFTADTVGIGAVSTTFDYGDGASGSNLTHTYTDPGTYTVTVTATDSQNNSSTDSTTIDVLPVGDLALVIKNTADWSTVGQTLNLNVNDWIQLDASGSLSPSSDPINFTWDIGDGSLPTGGATLSHLYSTAGKYTIHLNGRVGTTQADRYVTVNVTQPTAVASMTIVGSRQVVSGETVTFDATASHNPADRIRNYHFDFGDGSVVDDYTGTVQHTYLYTSSRDPRGLGYVTYDPVLTITDSTGQEVSYSDPSVRVTVSRSTGAPSVLITNPPANIITGQPVTFTAIATDEQDGDLAASIDWYVTPVGQVIGDPDDTGSSLIYTFATPGTYIIQVMVSDSDGVSDADQITVTVQ